MALLSRGMALRRFIDANNSFAVAAYRETLKSHQGNFLVSPLATEIVLAFVESGCKDATAHEIRIALCLPNIKEKIELGISSFLVELEESEEHCTIHSANKVYVQNTYSIKEEFKEGAHEVYHAHIETIDFTQKEKTATTINQWVEEKTNNKIEKIINSDCLNDLTKIIIVNALYFKADWAIKFRLDDTDPLDFYINAKDKVTVDAMRYFPHYHDYFNYYCSKGLKAQFLELPFKGKDTSMVIILPDEREGLAFLEKQIDKVFTVQKFKSTSMTIALPKFKIGSEIDLKEVLQNLGVRKAFSEVEADLSGISGEKGDLLVDKIIQKTFIDVNDEGTEATAVDLDFCKVVGPPPVIFMADHPFMFYIKIKEAIALVGRVTNPLL